MPTPQQIADEIFDLYAKYGRADYIGEPVSQIEHMAQAAQIAEREGFDDDVVLAAFFHDIGHICVNEEQYRNMGGFGNQEHEKVGAEFLRQRGFAENICQLVGNHVIAKRYLTYKYPEYYTKLSEASKETLRFQGGPMTAFEATEFEQNPLFTASIKLREWDELAKEEHTPLPDLNVYKQIAVNHLSRNHK